MPGLKHTLFFHTESVKYQHYAGLRVMMVHVPGVSQSHWVTLVSQVKGENTQESRKHSVLCSWWIQHILWRVLHSQCCKHDAIFHHLSPLTSFHSHRHFQTRTVFTFKQSLQTATVTVQKDGRGKHLSCSPFKSQHQGCYTDPQKKLCVDS